MRHRLAGRLAAVLALSAGLAWSGLATGQDGRPDPGNPGVVERGKVVYDEHCARCHGENLEGEPNWQRRKPNGELPAPPHNASGHTWHHSDKQLFDMVKNGTVATLPPGYKTGMPAYKDKLSDADIWAGLSYIESTWPSEIRAKRQRMNQEKH